MGKQKFPFWGFLLVPLPRVAEQEHPNSWSTENAPVPTRATNLSWDNADTPSSTDLCSPSSRDGFLRGLSSSWLTGIPGHNTDTQKDHPIPRAAPRNPSWVIPLHFHVEAANSHGGLGGTRRMRMKLEVPKQDTELSLSSHPHSALLTHNFPSILIPTPFHSCTSPALRQLDKAWGQGCRRELLLFPNIPLLFLVDPPPFLIPHTWEGLSSHPSPTESHGGSKVSQNHGMLWKGFFL